MEMLEFSFFTHCTCGGTLKARLIGENTTIEVEPCERCIDRVFKEGYESKRVTIEPLRHSHSSGEIQRDMEYILKHCEKINNL